MEERNRKTEFLVGLFLFVGLLMLAGLILEFSSIRETLKKSYTLWVPLQDASGIKSGTPVVLGGSRIGKVAADPKLNSEFNGVIVTLSIYEDKKIPADAKFGIGTAGLMGDSFVEIKTSGTVTDKYLEPNTFVTQEHIAPPGGLSALQDSAKEISDKVNKALEELSATVADLRGGIRRINEGALSQKSMDDIQGTLSHLNKVVTRLDEKTLGDQTSEDVKATIANLKDATKEMDDQVKRIGPMFDKLEPAFSKVDKVVADADKVMGSANSAVKSLEKSVLNIGDSAKQIRSGAGLVPALLGDAELKNNFKALVENLRRHGVLWYRDSVSDERPKRDPDSHGTRSGSPDRKHP